MNKVAAMIPGLILALVVLSGGCVALAPPSAPEATSALAPGVYEFEVGNSLYPKSRGASIGFQRHLNTGEEVTGIFEWKGNYSVGFKWSLYVYAPDGSSTLSWSGANLEHNFCFTPATPGTYKIEILKRDYSARCARLTIDRWGKN